MNDYDPSSDFDFPAPSIDPHSPERVRAAKYAVAAKVCKILTFVFFAWIFVGGAVVGEGGSVALLLFALPSIAASILEGVFKNKELKLRCTKRTTAFCVDTVRRHSGRHAVRHPIVEYEVKGVTYTAELKFSCSRDAVGDTFPIDYDPLDPNTVRAKRRGLFE